MKHSEYSFISKVWQYPGFGGWHFVNVPKQPSEEIRTLYAPVKKRGWGAIAVNVTIGTSTWKTSIFPSKEGGYLLAIKQAIRTKENIAEDDMLSVTIKIVEAA